MYSIHKEHELTKHVIMNTIWAHNSFALELSFWLQNIHIGQLTALLRIIQSKKNSGWTFA